MIYVRIELWPGGNKERAKLLGEATIANIGGYAHDARGTYSYRLEGKAHTLLKAGRVTGFPRKRLLGWDLLYRVLRDARRFRNPDPDIDHVER